MIASFSRREAKGLDIMAKGQMEMKILGNVQCWDSILGNLQNLNFSRGQGEPDGHIGKGQDWVVVGEIKG